MKKRSEIESNYKWDLKALFESDEQIEKEIEETKNLLDKVLTYKGKIMTSSENLYNFYQDYEKLERTLSKVLVYTHLNYDQDTTNSEAKKLQLKVEKFCDDVNEKLSFITPEMLSVSYEKVEEFLKDDEKLKVYAFDLKQLFKYKAHTLSEKEEMIISQANMAMGYCYDVFDALDNTDIYLGEVMIDGKKEEITNSNYSVLLRNKNRNIRKKVFEKMYQYFKNHINTIAANYRGNIKEEFFQSKVHKFNSPLEKSLYADDISIDVYKNLIATVHDNLDKQYHYFDVKKKLLNLDEMHMYDVYLDVNEKESAKIDFEKGKEILFEALKPLGETYLNDLKQAFEQKWVDIYPNQGKKSGAYSSGCYDSYPYVLLNYENTVSDVSTLVHELGHSMHSYYTHKNQPYTYGNYSIFLAEIASTVNEMLLNNYLYEHASSNEEKIKYLNEFLETFRATIFRQTMFAEYEMKVFDKEQKGVPLTKDELCSTYYDLNKLYFGDNVISDEDIKYEWARIPHFYTPFYVYKYATGLSAALAIVSDILNDKEGARDKYLEFLKSGCSNYPLEILKKAGVDMTTKEPIIKAMEIFNSKVSELEELVNE